MHLYISCIKEGRRRAPAWSNSGFLKYTKSRFFAVLVSENTGKTLFGTYKKSLLGLFGVFEHLRVGAKSREGLHSLNIDNLYGVPAHGGWGANLTPPGGGAVEGGGSYLPYSARYENRK